jgi:acyl-coenzyme A synthetase/AMP-(fatty) acid ligase
MVRRSIPAICRFGPAVAAAEPLAEAVRVSGDDPFILIYTSGTTAWVRHNSAALEAGDKV